MSGWFLATVERHIRSLDRQNLGYSGTELWEVVVSLPTVTTGSIFSYQENDSPVINKPKS